MSFNVAFMIDTGGPEPVPVGLGQNYTYNCAPMFRVALGGAGLRELDGKLAADVVERLTAAVGHMADPANSETYEALNPPNGWGNHQTALEFLRDVLSDAMAHPKSTVVVS